MAEIQAGATWVLANDLYETQNKPGEAVALCDAYFKVYPSSARFWARNLYQLWADTSALAPLPPEDALTRAQSVAKFLVEGNPLDPPTGLLAPQPGLIWDIVLLYQKGGQADQGRQFIEEFPYKVPDIVEEPLYWKARVMMYLAAGELELAKQAAVAGYRLTPLVSDPAADPPLQLLLRTLLLTDGKTTVVNFLRYLQTGQGDNPLGGVAPFPMTDEQRQEQTGIVGGVWARAVDACLLNGQYAEALHAAQVESLGAGPQADAGVTDIARCFKAKDLNCVRANQYLAWAKNPQGPNPVSSF
jgi:hypothetical protein